MPTKDKHCPFSYHPGNEFYYCIKENCSLWDKDISKCCLIVVIDIFRDISDSLKKLS